MKLANIISIRVRARASSAVTIKSSTVKVSFDETETVTSHDDSIREIVDDESNSNKCNSNNFRINNHNQNKKKDKNIRSPHGILIFMTNDISVATRSSRSSSSAELILLRNKAILDYNNKKECILQANHMKKLNVHFSDVTIRKYPYEIGDNPSSKYGPALSMQWVHMNEYTYPIHEYEDYKDQQYIITKKRNRIELMIPSYKRYQILHDAGYSRSQIVSETKHVNLVRQQRQRTLETLNTCEIDENIEQMKRQMIHVLTLGHRNRQEMKYIQYSLSLD